MDSPNFQFETESEYKDFDKGTGAWAIKPGPAAIPAIPAIPGSVDAEENFDSTPLWQQITFGGASGWATATDQFHSSPKSFKNNTGGSFTIYNDFFSEQISFWFKSTMVPSAPDFFEVKIDGTTVLTISSPGDWTYYAIPTGFGYQIDFIFTKNFPFPSSACWLDDLITGGLDTPGVPGSPAHPFVYTPLKMTDDGERLKVDVTGSVEVTTNLDCETDSVTICQGTDPLIVEISNQVQIDDYVPIQVQPPNLNCEDDSVTICQGPDPITVEIIAPVQIDDYIPIQVQPPNLDCSTDSVTICPGADPIPVTFNCETDSITICPGTEPIPVVFNLACETDSVTVCNTGASLQNGTETAVSSVAVLVLAANPNRKKLIIQNTGTANIRFGVIGVTATSGTRLVPDGHAIFDMPDCPLDAIYAIREAADSVVFATEIT